VGRLCSQSGHVEPARGLRDGLSKSPQRVTDTPNRHHRVQRFPDHGGKRDVPICLWELGSRPPMPGVSLEVPACPFARTEPAGYSRFIKPIILFRFRW